MHAAIQLPNVGNTPVVMVAFSLTGGFVLLVLGGEGLVRGSVAAAHRLGASALLIGRTLVGVGTSLPELVTPVLASWRNQSDVALGNVVGSKIFNVLGVLGMTAVVQPLVVPAQILDFDL
jgi:cation:H+ antiporter